MVSVTRSGIFFYHIQLDRLGHSPPCFKHLQHLEQEGVVPPNLSSFGKKIYIYGHTTYGIRSLEGTSGTCKKRDAA